MTNSIDEIRDTDLMFVIGSNTTEAHPIIAMEMKRARQKGAKLIVADPREIWMAEHRRFAPATAGQAPMSGCCQAMAHVIVSEGPGRSRRLLKSNTEGFEAVARTSQELPPEEAEKITGVPAEDIRHGRPVVRDDRKGRDLLHAGHHRTHPWYGQRLFAWRIWS